MRKKNSEIHGFLLVDKPTGETSFDVVRQIKRLLGTAQVGHAGTLDPLASGLLVVALGRATKLIRFVQAAPKTYLARVVFHARSETDDAEGPFHPVENPPAIGEEALRAALAGQLGERDQMPPAYSAKKIGGKRAYHIAREGKTPNLKPARVVAHRLDLLACRESEGAESGAGPGGILEADVRCEVGTGYYVRSLARDLGAALGTAAYLGALRRLTIGRFDVREAFDGGELARLADRHESGRPAPGMLRKSLRSPFDALRDFPHYDARPEEVRLLMQGKVATLNPAQFMVEAPAEAHPADAPVVLCDEAGPALLARWVDPERTMAKIDLNLQPIRDAVADLAP